MPKSVLFDRDEIIGKVTNLFWEKGYNGTSMQDLVDVTGLNRSSIYNSYGDKFQLFSEALRHYQKSQNNLLQSVQDKAKSPKAAIKLLFDGVWSEMSSGQTKGCFLSNCTTELSNTDPRIHQFLSENQKVVVKTFEKLIMKSQEAGEIDTTKNPEILAQYLFSSLQGLRVTAMIDGDAMHIKGIADQVLSTL
jgi:TetR/AcrR family transcriptional repressor of nem operon